jgi:2-polyprenyl-6-hydroxyphenyl methylase/3-demethylubiquinone-9 3-methyltransferase
MSASPGRGPMPACKCCTTTATYLGALDFNKTALDRSLGRRVFPVSAETVPYYYCPYCGFVFTDYCDRWTEAQFRTRIYNDEYEKADADTKAAQGVAATTSYRNGKTLAGIFEGAQHQIRVLDFGAGGNPGRAGQAMIDAGFDVTSYEPYFPGGETALSGTYDLIYAIEVVEHAHDPFAMAQLIAGHLAEHGLLYISTVLHTAPTSPAALDSWYIAPRNGHISIYTLAALTLLFRRVGVNIVQSSFGILGFRKLPNFPNGIFV